MENKSEGNENKVILRDFSCTMNFKTEIKGYETSTKKEKYKPKI